MCGLFSDGPSEAAAIFRKRSKKSDSRRAGISAGRSQPVKAQEYDPRPHPKQPEPAYLINLEARVKHLAGRINAMK